jgi:hypothetical protein
MEDEKSIAKKLTEVISKAAVTVKHAVSHAVESASDAAQHAMEANAEKLSRIPPARFAPGQVAGTTNEQVYIPEANDAAAMPMPLVAVAPAARQRKSPAKPSVSRTVAKTRVKAAKRKSTAKKSAARPARKPVANKTAKKSAARSPQKARPKSGK